MRLRMKNGSVVESGLDLHSTLRWCLSRRLLYPEDADWTEKFVLTPDERREYRKFKALMEAANRGIRKWRSGG